MRLSRPSFFGECGRNLRKAAKGNDGSGVSVRLQLEREVREDYIERVKKLAQANNPVLATQVQEL